MQKWIEGQSSLAFESGRDLLDWVDSTAEFIGGNRSDAIRTVLAHVREQFGEDRVRSETTG